MACNPEPEKVIFGSEFCHQCAMGIHDHRYGGILLTKKGKSYKFDSLECLLRFEKNKLKKTEEVKARYVFNTFKKGELIRLEHAHFLKIKKMRSPMGAGIWASDSAEEISKAKGEYDGEILDWLQLQNTLDIQ